MSVFSTAKISVLILPGDGIGKEVSEEAIKVLETVSSIFGLKLDLKKASIGGEAIDKYGKPLPDKTLELAKERTAIFLGAVGGEKWDNIDRELRPESGLLKIRKELGLAINLRPVKVFEALKDDSPVKPHLISGVDIMIVRDLLGGLYFGTPRGMIDDTAGERVSVNTESCNESSLRKLAKVAFTIASKRGSKLCSVDKANVLESGALWREVVSSVREEGFKNVELSNLYVDNAAMQLIRDPKQFDVLFTTNMFGDILSDEASVLSGSLGMLPSASLCYSDDTKVKGLYEPCHGSAPTIAGQGIANPIASILSIAMMFEYSFGMLEASKKINDAVSAVLSSGYRTKDIFGSQASDLRMTSTSQMGDLIVENIKKGS